MPPEFIQTQYRFLLGGKDLEMVEIRLMLEGVGLEEGDHFFDRDLAWDTATLSAYEDVLSEQDKTLVGIELVLDRTAPSHYLHIDHHNQLRYLPASIEQLAALLRIPLTRDQRLVAANDKGYIPAMKDLGATQAEITNIRNRDRQAQGVTEEMEQQAVEDLDLKEKRGATWLIRTTLQRFSPITDRMYGKGNLLIYSDEELTYFGENVSRLEAAYVDMMRAGKAYSGGQGVSGFWGIGKGVYSPTEIAKEVNRIIEILEEN